MSLLDTNKQTNIQGWDCKDDPKLLKIDYLENLVFCHEYNLLKDYEIISQSNEKSLNLQRIVNIRKKF